MKKHLCLTGEVEQESEDEKQDVKKIEDDEQGEKEDGADMLVAPSPPKL